MASEKYVVVGALASFSVTDAAGGTQKLTFYKGQVVPSGAPQEEIDHHLSVKLIEPVGEVEIGLDATGEPVRTEGDESGKPADGPTAPRRGRPPADR